MVLLVPRASMSKFQLALELHLLNVELLNHRNPADLRQGWYAEMENEERSENVKAGQARARAQGKENGRPGEIGTARSSKSPN